MKLLTKELEQKMPALYAQDGKGKEAIVYIKFFFPASPATWYATEYDKTERIFFGWADMTGTDGEFGYFALEGLEEVVGRMGLKIERDMSFKPKTLGECLATKA